MISFFTQGNLRKKHGDHIGGAVSFPLCVVVDNIRYLPSFDTHIVNYRGSGWRCTIALTVLEALGWEDMKGLKGASANGPVPAIP